MVNIFDTWVMKAWKSSPKDPVDSLPLEVFKSGLNALQAVKGGIRSGQCPGRGHAARQATAEVPYVSLMSHIRGMLQGMHTPASAHGTRTLWGQSPCSAQGQGCLFGCSSLVAILVSITLSLGQASAGPPVVRS